MELFRAFFAIGALTFGGGYAMLPMLEREVVEHHHWATSEELLDYYAISQCTPGVIAVNVATMIGYRQKGLRGAAMATLGVVCPSIIIILLIAGVLKNVSHLAAVQHAFGGIRVAVSVLILSAITKLFKSSVVDPLTAVIFVVGLGITLLFHPSPILLVLCAGALGIGVKYFGAHGKKEAK
ncbi:MAG: chromate transporter [Oscillospiraceae bacterium]